MTILTNPTCVCETREKLESACRDLLRERDALRAEVDTLNISKLGLIAESMVLRREAKEDAEKYYQLWQSVIRFHEEKTVVERDRLLVLATKHCDKHHHDWQELLRIAGDA
jgi:predicted nucleic-acid-binding protein